MADLDAIERSLERQRADGGCVPTVEWEEVDDLMAIARWAQDAPHYDGCLARHNTDSALASMAKAYPCQCGRDEVMPRG